MTEASGMDVLFTADEAGGIAGSENGVAPREAGLPAGLSLLQVAADLHRLAHPGEPAEIAACRREPCRLVPIAEVTGQAPGTAALRC